MTNRRRPFFGDDIKAKFISLKPVLWILNNIMYFTNFFQQNEYIYLKEFPTRHRHLTVQVKHSYTLPVCVCCISLERKARSFCKVTKVIFISCFNINLQQDSFFKSNLYKRNHLLFNKVSSFKKEINYLKNGAPSIYI